MKTMFLTLAAGVVAFITLNSVRYDIGGVLTLFGPLFVMVSTHDWLKRHSV